MFCLPTFRAYSPELHRDLNAKSTIFRRYAGSKEQPEAVELQLEDVVVGFERFSSAG
jgi:hypothetical protein